MSTSQTLAYADGSDRGRAEKQQSGGESKRNEDTKDRAFGAAPQEPETERANQPAEGEEG